jgi:hypothetical protein
VVYDVNDVAGVKCKSMLWSMGYLIGRVRYPSTLLSGGESGNQGLNKVVTLCG